MSGKVNIFCTSWNLVTPVKPLFNNWCCRNCQLTYDKSNGLDSQRMYCFSKMQISYRKSELNWWCCQACWDENENLKDFNDIKNINNRTQKQLKSPKSKRGSKFKPNILSKSERLQKLKNY